MSVSGESPWRVMRFEKADGKYAEVASNVVSPEQVQIPAGYRFVRSTPMVPTSELDEVYAERNAVVLAFATLARALGWHVGKAVDASEPGWPVLLIDTPEGQVSWHFKADDMPSDMPVYRGHWDGHDTPEKYDRLKRLVAAHGA